MSLWTDIVDLVVARFRGNTPQLTKEASARDPDEVIVKPRGLADLGGKDPKEFHPPEFDLKQITDAYNTEAYVRQAVDKYIELMFKSGWDIVGANPNAVDYIKQRLAVCAEATQTPIDQFFIGCAEDLVKYSNVIIAKAREDGYPWPQGLNVQGLGDLDPVVGYFPLNVTTMAVRRDRHGVVKGWQQEVEGEDKPVKFRPEDVVHIYYKREKGHAFGTPFLLPALDDIRALRQAEENVLRLIYRNLYPFYHYQIGSPEYPGTDEEIKAAKTAIEDMDTEGGLVTSERHKITAIASDRIIDANPYLKYFEDRVFTGLGVPATVMGRGSTANRSTSDNMSTEFIDRVKAMQKVFAVFVDEFIIKELLMEGGFDPVINPQDDVDFVFKEIDIDTKIKQENHAIFQYEHNAITEDEMRTLLGREPITERGQMYMYLVTIPAAEAGAAAKSSAETDNKNKPTNQHKTKPSPKKEDFERTYADCMHEVYDDLGDQVVALVERRFRGEATDLALSQQLAGLMSKAEQDLVRISQQWLPKSVSEAQHKYIRHTIKQTYDMTVNYMSSIGTEEALVTTIMSVFNVLGSRVTALADEAYQSTREGVDA